MGKVCSYGLVLIGLSGTKQHRYARGFYHVPQYAVSTRPHPRRQIQYPTNGLGGCRPRLCPARYQPKPTPTRAPIPTLFRGDIAFENVVFSYNDQDAVLRGISFQVAAGQTLALVGVTGAGKSSIINILNRFYDIQSGEVSIDGRNIKEYELYALRRQIGLVLQDVFLFAGSIYDNIVLHNSTSAANKQ